MTVTPWKASDILSSFLDTLYLTEWLVLYLIRLCVLVTHQIMSTYLALPILGWLKLLIFFLRYDDVKAMSIQYKPSFEF